jgi:hypothetical protein
LTIKILNLYPAGTTELAAKSAVLSMKVNVSLRFPALCLIANLLWPETAAANTKIVSSGASFP